MDERGNPHWVIICLTSKRGKKSSKRPIENEILRLYHLKFENVDIRLHAGVKTLGVDLQS